MGPLSGHDAATEIVRVLTLLAFSFLITFATGWILVGYGTNPAGIGDQDYGFPLPWRDVIIPCASGPPICSQAGGTLFYLGWFVVDVLFYVVIGYGLLLMLKRFRVKTEDLKPASN